MSIRHALAIVLALAVGACSSGDFGEGASPLQEGAKIVGSMLHRSGAGKVVAAPGPGGLPAGLSRESLAGVKGPLILARIEKISAAATLRLARENGAYGTWVSPDRLSMTFKDGVLVASRGLAGDLLAGEADATLAAIRGRRAASYGKTLRFIGGERQILVGRLTCRSEVVGAETIEVLDVAHATTHIAEICANAEGGTLRNDYWIGGDQVMWKSRQFLHPVLGYVTVERLLR